MRNIKKLFWPPFWNEIIFKKCYFGNVNLFIFSFFEPNFIEKLLWESGFSKFGQNRNDMKIKIGYLAAILKQNNILASQCLLNSPLGISTCYYGERAFAASAPKLWNALPLSIKNAPSVAVFKKLLKTHLFNNPIFKVTPAHLIFGSKMPKILLRVMCW